MSRASSRLILRDNDRAKDAGRCTLDSSQEVCLEVFDQRDDLRAGTMVREILAEF